MIDYSQAIIIDDLFTLLQKAFKNLIMIEVGNQGLHKWVTSEQHILVHMNRRLISAGLWGRGD